MIPGAGLIAMPRYHGFSDGLTGVRTTLGTPRYSSSAVLTLDGVRGEHTYAGSTQGCLRSNYAVSGMTFDWTTLLVKVQNLAFAKQVDLFYSAYGTSAWQVANLPFVRTFGNYDLFGTTSVAGLSFVEDFAIRYIVNGSTYWDNNGGANYHIGLTYSGTVGGNVTLNNATAMRAVEAGGGFTVETSWFQGDILVNNLAYSKRVGVVYSKDGGLNWQTVNATYTGKLPGVAAPVAEVEVWTFRTPELNLDTSSSVFRFAVYLDVVNWGVTYWDNNFGQDYFLSKVAGSELE